MSSPNLIRVGLLEIDLARYRLLRRGEVVRLTPTEWNLLRELLHHPNQVLSHRTLLKRVWGDEYETELDYVHTYISRLRRKLEPDNNDPAYILTEAGIGYRFNGDMIDSDDTSVDTSDGVDRLPSPLRGRTVNPLPQHVEGRYIGRQAAREQLETLLLDDSTQLVSLYGRAGVGKTALACKVLADLMAARHFDGMVFLSATSTGISLGRILSDFDRLLDEAPPVDVGQAVYRVTNLLDRLSKGRYLLLLDNLEHLQNPLTNDLMDEDMTTLFRVVLEQGGTLQILVTSRYPLNLPHTIKMRERVVSLEEGLPLDDSVALLRQGDPDGLAGLQDAPYALLAELARRTHGLPRALEAAIGILLESPLMMPEDLLQDESLLAAEVGEMFIAGVINTLPDDAVRVMELVSMFGRDVPLSMLETLAAENLQNGGLRVVLNRLVRAFFLTYSTVDQTVSMHPIDRNTCYERIPARERSDLHRTIADLYEASFEEDGTAAGLGDLSEPLAAFSHRVWGGQHTEAAVLLLQLDADHLSIWGNYAELAEGYGRVVAHITDERLLRRVLLRQGEALRRIGKLGDAIRCFERVSKLAVAAEDIGSRATALSSLGWVHYDTGQFAAAIEVWQAALLLFREIGDRYGEGDLLGGLGWVSYLMGAYDEALNNIQQSFLIFGEIGDQLYRIGMNIGDSGVIRAAQGDHVQAVRNLREALSIAEVTNSVNEKSYKGGYLAMVLLFSGDDAGAEDAARTAVQYDVPANRHFVAAVHGVALARLGRVNEASVAFEDAVRYAEGILRFTSGLYHARYAHALALAGLALLHDGDLVPVVEDYGRAKAMCSTAGVIAFNLRLLRALDPDDRLRPVRQLLES